tara:strand:- start:88 stop:483 length:396 start_codon:yes stop_codon:yes gene_type:complete
VNVRDEIRKAIEHGIYLGDLGKEEVGEFLKELQTFLIKKGNFCIYNDPTHTIEISNDFRNLARIFIDDNTLRITPLAAEGYFKIFMDVLEFVAGLHREKIEEIEKMKQIEQKNLLDCSEEDESTEEDDLWL